MELWRKLLTDGSVKLFHKNGVLNQFISGISNEGFDIYNFDCSEWGAKNYHTDLAATLDFPDHYGKNLDAFNDCLSDVVPKNSGIVLVFKNYDSFAEKNADDAYQILDIIQINAWRFLIEDIKLLAFIQSNDPNIDFPDLGGLSAEWNDEEWFNKNRGL